MFKDEEGEGQQSLYNLLKAYSVYDPACGYCQGLSFVVAPLLMENMSELEAFAVFVRLMEESPTELYARKYGLRRLFTPQMDGLHLLLFQHSELVRLYLPELHAHFLVYGVGADAYAAPWFLTLFTYNFPLNLVFRIFDIIFAEGAATTMLKFSIALLSKNQDILLQKQDLEEILELLKGPRLFKAYEGDPEKVVQDAMSLSGVINETVLDKLGVDFTNHCKKNMDASDREADIQRLTLENFKLANEVTQLRSLLLSAEDRRLRDLNSLRLSYEEKKLGVYG
ncbi:hypothetical protein HDV05_001298 [Chytridiales sp. JEL 0842]|nr:hypothetical protein HDV05_001298 [Chytridiales sp. JEL 0842]